MILDTDPLEAAGDELHSLQTCFTDYGIPADRDGVVLFTSDADYTGGEAVGFNSVGDYAEWPFTTEYDIPASEFVFATRGEADGADPVEVSFIIDGETLASHGIGGAGLAWRNQDGNGADDDPVGTLSNDLPAGTHTARIEATASGADTWIVDTVAPRDNRFTYTDDNTLDGSQGHLDGPEFYPNQLEVLFETVKRQRLMTTADVTSTWDDTSGGEFIEVRIGTDAFSRSANSTTASTTHSGSGDTNVDVRVAFSRYGSQSTTPKTGINGQSLQSYELTANPDAIYPHSIGVSETDAVVPQGSVSGEVLREAAQLTSGGTALSRAVFAGFTVASNTTVRSSEKTAFDPTDPE